MKLLKQNSPILFRIITLGICTLLFCINPNNAQVECFDKIGNSNILGIEEDEQYLWLGTDGDGLMRIEKATNTIAYFDTNNTSLDTDVVKSVHYNNGQLYVSSDSSLYTFSNDDFTLISAEVEGIITTLPNSNNDLIVAGRRDYYVLHVNTIFYHQNLMDLVTDECCAQTTDVLVDPNGNVWLNHFDFYKLDILKNDGGSWTAYNSSNSVLPIESFQINSLALDSNKVLASSETGIYQYENDVWEALFPNPNIAITNGVDTIDQSFMGMAFDSDEWFWVGTRGLNKVAYHNGFYWDVLTINNNQLLEINRIFPSDFNNDIIYFGTNDGLYIFDKSCLEVATKDELKLDLQLSLSPNPAKDRIYLDWQVPLSGSFDLMIYDMQGKLVLSKSQLQNPIEELNVAGWQAGVYQLVIRQGGKLGSIILLRNKNG